MGDSADTARALLSRPRKRVPKPQVTLRRSGPVSAKPYTTTRPVKLRRSGPTSSKPYTTQRQGLASRVANAQQVAATMKAGGGGGLRKIAGQVAGKVGRGLSDVGKKLGDTDVLMLSGANGRPRGAGIKGRDVAREIGEQTGVLPASRIARGKGSAWDAVAMAGILPLSPAKYARLAKLVNPETLAAIKDADQMIQDMDSLRGAREIVNTTTGEVADPEAVRAAMEFASPRVGRGKAVFYRGDAPPTMEQAAADFDQWGDVFPSRYTGITPQRGKSVFASGGNIHHGELRQVARERGVYDTRPEYMPEWDDLQWEIFGGTPGGYNTPRMGIGGGLWAGAPRRVGDLSELFSESVPGSGITTRQKLEVIRQLQRMRRSGLGIGNIAR